MQACRRVTVSNCEKLWRGRLALQQVLVNSAGITVYRMSYRTARRGYRAGETRSNRCRYREYGTVSTVPVGYHKYGADRYTIKSDFTPAG